MTEQAEDRNGPPRETIATHLVRIATDLFTFHRTGDIVAGSGEVVSEGHPYARPKGNPEVRRDLEDIRPDIAEVYETEHGRPPGRAALADAMTVLIGKARKAQQDPPGPAERAEGILLASGIGQVAPDRGLGLVTGCDDCPLPEGYSIPEPYVVGDDGIHLAKHDGSGYARVTWAWLFPVRVYVDPAGDQLVELAWRDGRRWVSRLVRRAITKSGRKLVTEVGDAGLPIIEAEARQAERWLAAAEAANRDVIARHPVARQLGWQADCTTFVTAQDSPWRVEPRYSDQAAALAAHKPRGTLAGWQQVIEGISDYPIVQVGLYAGLAAALLVPLDLDSFTVDLSGRSTRGKTITAQVGLSCWADPGERSDGLFSWKTKIIGVEKRLNLVCGLPVVIDETRVVTSTELVDAVIYQVPKNHGQARGGGWPNMIPWRTIVISTGEQPAISFTSHQGASARVLTVQQPPFGAGGTESRHAAEETKGGVEANYGTAGPAFAARLQAGLAEDGGRDKLRTRHEELTELLRGGNDMTGRRAPLAACLALAAELAAEWEVVPLEAPGPSTWLDLFTSPDQRDNRPEMALEIMREFIASHADKLWGGRPKAKGGDDEAGGDERPPATGWIGREVDGGIAGNTEGGIALLPEKVREELKRRGYELDAVIPGWLEHGVLAERKGQEPPIKIPVRIAGHSTRCLVFLTEALEKPAGDAGGVS